MTTTPQDLTPPDMHDVLVTFPPVYAIDEFRSGNRIRQIVRPQTIVRGALIPFSSGRGSAFLFRPQEGDEEVLIVSKINGLPSRYSRILHAPVPVADGMVDLMAAKWLRHPSQGTRCAGTADHRQEIRETLASWTDAFEYVQEEPHKNKSGLRGPQIGALHAVHAHWSVTDAPATVVMPTGTGKTETMLSVLISARCPKLLVIVPTDALRAQLADKFLTLGVLKDPDVPVLKPKARRPIVGLLQRIPRTVDEVDDIFGVCQVIVTTSSIAGQCEAAVQERMAHHCPYLFIDEAHHAEALTWSTFKAKFSACRVLQFTATPFREDGKPLDGDIVYKYPLRKAQHEGYFRPIQFVPVVEFNPGRADEAIAARAIEQLRTDAAKGHVLMARVSNVERAKKVFKLYEPYVEFNPVALHSGIKSAKERERIRRQIISGESRIVVCVDMLGEGFDLPELKIAAFHDIRKTLAVTLQLAGRFTRAREGLGEATFIANTADISVQEELRKLYARDPDWNALLGDLSEQMIGQQQSLQEFLRGFANFTEEIPLKTVRPAISAVVYRTACTNWSPENCRRGIVGLSACEQVHTAINHEKNTLVVVTARRVPLVWTDVENLFGWEWELYVVIWSPEQNLLFINSSSNAGEYRTLAQAVAGEDAKLIDGQDVFRIFAGVRRLRLQNAGLTEQLGRNVRYTGRMGADVESGVSDVQRRRARKSVLSGTGFEGGKKVTVGASRRGRIWAFRRETVDGLAKWCKEAGSKLLDDQIDPDQVLRGTLHAKAIGERPGKMPITIDWPEEMYRVPEANWALEFAGRTWSLSEVGIDLARPDVQGPLVFTIASDSDSVELELQLFKRDNVPNYRFVVERDKQLTVRRGDRAESLDVTEFFYESPPMLWFVDGSSLEGNQYVEPKDRRPPYDVSKIEAWDWSGIDLQKESQGEDRDPTSIQARVIQELRGRDYAVIVDDDGKGETADIVTIRLVGDAELPSCIEVEFYHCKYSLEASPGHRIKDLYEVCGQAQKSISWMSSAERQADIFTHLLRREAIRQQTGRKSRFEKGDNDLLLTIREMSRLRPVALRILIVQPGLSKAEASRDQLELVSVTENHLLETYQLPFGVIASA